MTYSSGRTFPWPNADVIDPSSRVPASQHHPALAALLKLQISMDLMRKFQLPNLYILSTDQLQQSM